MYWKQPWNNVDLFKRCTSILAQETTPPQTNYLSELYERNLVTAVNVNKWVWPSTCSPALHCWAVLTWRLCSTATLVRSFMCWTNSRGSVSKSTLEMGWTKAKIWGPRLVCPCCSCWDDPPLVLKMSCTWELHGNIALTSVFHKSHW